MPAVVAKCSDGWHGHYRISAMRTHGVRLALFADSELTCDRITASSSQQSAPQSVGWMMPR
jgi:hypothetical protein